MFAQCRFCPRLWRVPAHPHIPLGGSRTRPADSGPSGSIYKAALIPTHLCPGQLCRPGMVACWSAGDPGDSLAPYAAGPKPDKFAHTRPDSFSYSIPAAKYLLEAGKGSTRRDVGGPSGHGVRATARTSEGRTERSEPRRGEQALPKGAPLDGYV